MSVQMEQSNNSMLISIQLLASYDSETLPLLLAVEMERNRQ